MRRLALLALPVLVGCPTGLRVDAPPMVELPSCAEMDGAAALYVPGRVSSSGVGVRRAGQTRPPPVEWLVNDPRFLGLVPASLVPSGDEVSVNPETMGILTTDPAIPDNYLPGFTQQDLSAGELTVWTRVDVRELCGPNPPSPGGLTVWISTRVETTQWSFVFGG